MIGPHDLVFRELRKGGVAVLNLSSAASHARLTRRIRFVIGFFMVALVVSGLTAFGVETQMRLALPYFPSEETALGAWLWKVYRALQDTNYRYPFLSYGFDWLAFAHIVIAVAFIGPWRDPLRNQWVIHFGMIACVMVFPLALVMGGYRGLPLGWRLVDCSFGVGGLIVLGYCNSLINRLARVGEEVLA